MTVCHVFSACVRFIIVKVQENPFDEMFAPCIMHTENEAVQWCVQFMCKDKFSCCRGSSLCWIWCWCR